MYNQTAAPPVSRERAAYLQKRKRKKYMIRTVQVSMVIILLALWEILADIGVIDSFIMSQPSRMVKTLLHLSENGLLTHLGVTCAETLVGFLLGTMLGVGLAVLLWWSKTLSCICEPFLVVLNALPKIALGPVFIVWVGAGVQAIIVMALAISLIVTVLEMLNGFLSTDEETIMMVRTFGADRRQVFTKVVMPSNLHTLFHSMKVNIGLSLVGVIAGEFLVSKAGLGYLIVYGGQVFKLDLVMTSVVILAVVAALLYQSVVIAERAVTRKISHRN
ncbi:MAG TPA: sulfonate ABC transporter permease [Ruminococcaceae bacterium]|nr:sulfonate ABC transporter permease [Oscillospiraceae bacterium]HCB65387.1 sulfonate ABC transporter permease [Oscillospiraceae bacterium]